MELCLSSTLELQGRGLIVERTSAVCSPNIIPPLLIFPQVTEWTDKISESCIAKLRDMSFGMKFCVSVFIAQRTEGGGLHSELAMRYDPTTDGVCFLQWENETIACCLTVIGLAI
jgi:hypothetical protein